MNNPTYERAPDPSRGMARPWRPFNLLLYLFLTIRGWFRPTRLTGLETEEFPRLERRLQTYGNAIAVPVLVNWIADIGLWGVGLAIITHNQVVGWCGGFLIASALTAFEIQLLLADAGSGRSFVGVATKAVVSIAAALAFHAPLLATIYFGPEIDEAWVAERKLVVLAPELPNLRRLEREIEETKAADAVPKDHPVAKRLAKARAALDAAERMKLEASRTAARSGGAGTRGTEALQDLTTRYEAARKARGRALSALQRARRLGDEETIEDAKRHYRVEAHRVSKLDEQIDRRRSDLDGMLADADEASATVEIAAQRAKGAQAEVEAAESALEKIHGDFVASKQRRSELLEARYAAVTAWMARVAAAKPGEVVPAAEGAGGQTKTFDAGQPGFADKVRIVGDLCAARAPRFPNLSRRDQRTLLKTTGLAPPAKNDPQRISNADVYGDERLALIAIALLLPTLIIIGRLTLARRLRAVWAGGRVDDVRPGRDERPVLAEPQLPEPLSL